MLFLYRENEKVFLETQNTIAKILKVTKKTGRKIWE